ncbi:MAG: hypothetical protein LBC75_13425 [Fibromonadaceae bacterium]|jgi:uncharacterized protein (TIGR02145 family)|nr:hypothetical protein [Fibromonadaceae bacterium]
MKDKFTIALAILGFAMSLFLSCADNPALEYPSMDYFFGSSSSSSVPNSNSKVSSSSVALSSSTKSSDSAELSSSSDFTKPSSSSEYDVSSSAESSDSAEPSSSSEENSSSSCSINLDDLCGCFTEGTERLHYGRNKPQFCDPRDGKKYVYVEIDGQTWMAENLNLNASGSKCKEDNCTKYGRLYNWDAAKANCPRGWHLPSFDNLLKLVDFAGGIDYAGAKLKATSGWKDNVNGTDDYGFSALPGGYNTHVGDDVGQWWTSTSVNNNSVYNWKMEYKDGVIYSASSKDNQYSVRCLRDE